MTGQGFWDLLRTRILNRKAEGRRKMAALPFARKIEMLEAMRKRVEPIRQARASRKKHE